MMGAVLMTVLPFNVKEDAFAWEEIPMSLFFV